MALQLDASGRVKRRTSWRDETGTREPRQFNARNREIYLREYRQREFARISGQPQPAQVDWVEDLAALSWAIRLFRHEGSMLSLKQASDMTRLRREIRKDFERSLRPPEPRPRAEDEDGRRDPLGELRVYLGDAE